MAEKITGAGQQPKTQKAEDLVTSQVGASAGGFKAGLIQTQVLTQIKAALASKNAIDTQNLMAQKAQLEGNLKQLEETRDILSKTINSLS